jgi:hypothetical protein
MLTPRGDAAAWVLAGIVVALVVSACAGPELKSGTPNAAWVQEPLISFGNPDAVADEHCRRYGKSAVYKRDLSDPKSRQADTAQPTGVFLPIRVYDCK